jgi:phage terminase large subunit
MASALMKEVQELKARVAIGAGLSDPTTIGFVNTDGTLVSSIKRIGDAWADSDEEPQAYFPVKMKPVFTRPKRFIILEGGRGSGKSLGVGGKVLIDMHDHGDSWLCLREFQASIKDSVHGLLTEEKDRIGLEDFNVTDNTISSSGGGEARFAGIGRNPGSVKSAFGFKGFWGEEAQTFSEESLKILTPTARNKPIKGLPAAMKEVEDDEVDLTKVQMIFCVNPGSTEDPFSKRFLVPFQSELDAKGIYEDNLHLIIKMNWSDNPWFHLSGLEEERLWDFNNLPRALYDHIWEGKFNDSVENGLIMAEWFDACVDAHIKLDFGTGGIKKVTHDPSDVGSDPKALSLREGNVFTEVKERDDLDVNDGCDWATGYAIEVGADQFEWDVGGMGTGLKKQVNDSLQGKKMEIFMFNGASGVDDPDSIYQPALGENIQNEKNNKEMFKNLRGQCYSSVRDRVYKTYKAVIHHKMYDPDELISFSSGIANLSKLRSELCRMPIKPNGSGLFELYTKEQMRKMFKVSSPNLADCVMMSERIHIKEMGFQGDVNQLNIPMVNHW